MNQVEFINLLTMQPGRSMATSEFPYATEREMLDYREALDRGEAALRCLQQMSPDSRGWRLCKRALDRELARAQCLEYRMAGCNPPNDLLKIAWASGDFERKVTGGPVGVTVK